MRKICVSIILWLSLALVTFNASAQKIWQIGKEDNSAMEFALAKEGYANYSSHECPLCKHGAADFEKI